MKKLIYLNNISPANYKHNYAESHKQENDKMTYIVFAEANTRPENTGARDIFFNGHKITYLNELVQNGLVSDGYDNVLCYVNDKGGFDFSRATISISDCNGVEFGNYYDIYNLPHLANDINVTESNNELSYHLIFDLQKYLPQNVSISRARWNNPVVYENGRATSTHIFNINDGKIRLKNSETEITYTYEIKLSYTFKLTDTDDQYNTSNPWNKEYTSCAYANIYRASDIQDNMYYVWHPPTYLSVGDIYTPIMRTGRKETFQRGFEFSNPSDNIEFLNSYTGTFKCKWPGEIQFSYGPTGGETPRRCEGTMWIDKINPLLCTSVFNTTYLWSGDNEYNGTNCYAHFTTRGIDIPLDSVSWKMYRSDAITGETLNSTTTKYTQTESSNVWSYYSSTSARITSDNGDYPIGSSKFAIIECSLPTSYFKDNYNKSVMLLWNSSGVIAQPPVVTVDNIEYMDDGTVTFTVWAPKPNDSVVDTNYNFGDSTNLYNFNTYDIVVTPETTYSYVVASLVDVTAETCNIVVHTTDVSHISTDHVINNIALQPTAVLENSAEMHEITH